MKSILWQVILGAVAMILAFALALALGIVLAPWFQLVAEGA